MVWTELAFGVSCIRSLGHGWHSCLHPGPTAFSKQVGVPWLVVLKRTCYILIASIFATFFADGYRTLHSSSPNLPLLASSSRSFGSSLNHFLHLPILQSTSGSWLPHRISCNTTYSAYAPTHSYCIHIVFKPRDGLRFLFAIGYSIHQPF